MGVFGHAKTVQKDVDALAAVTLAVLPDVCVEGEPSFWENTLVNMGLLHPDRKSVV